jgi:L-seryl-tRNA(Ser) seleniumtransferase
VIPGDSAPSTGLRDLPSVDRLLRDLASRGTSRSHRSTVEAARAVLAAARAEVLAGASTPGMADLMARLEARLAVEGRRSARPVINATGVLVHTNLGRAPLSDAALDAITEAARGYSSLEMDLATGERGSRTSQVSELMSALTGAEAGLVVNNNASAVLLSLTVLAAGHEVVVSRGQAVEIGGGFRIPDVLRQSGASLVEVGTTNRTYLRDYEDALTPNTAALLHVHSSNFRVVGFTHDVALADLADLAERRGILLIDDNGSGALIDTAAFGLSHEPTVQESIAAGSAVVCFSGDKLLGGPQAGLICGRKELIDRIARHPLARAVRIDKLSLAALAATLLHYVRGEANARIPVWRMMGLSVGELDRRARNWAAGLAVSGWSVDVVDAESTVGGGSLPGSSLPTRCLSLEPTDELGGPGAVGALAAALRLGDPPIVGRIKHRRLLLDPRTVAPDDDDKIVAGLVAAGARLASQAL